MLLSVVPVLPLAPRTPRAFVPVPRCTTWAITVCSHSAVRADSTRSAGDCGQGVILPSRSCTRVMPTGLWKRPRLAKAV